MAIPTRTRAAIAALPPSIQGLNVEYVVDPSDGNPFFWITEGGMYVAFGINLAALVGATGLIAAELEPGEVTATEIADLNAVAAGAVGALKMGRWDYSFAVDGGAQATKALRGGALPAGVAIWSGLLVIGTDVASAADASGCGIGSEADGDLIVHAHTNAAPWDSTGNKAIVPVGTAATAVVTTVARTPSLKIEHADLTGGVFTLYLFYFVK